MKGSYMNVERTRLWADLQHAPGVLQRTLAARDGIISAAGLLRSGKARRLVAVGNGASSYIAQALWLASLETPGAAPVQVTAVPAGLLTTGRFSWEAGDAMLAISASGEARDLISAMRNLPKGVSRLALTASPESTIAGLADAVVRVADAPLDSLTHSHPYQGAVAAALATWAEATDDDTLRAALATTAEEVAARTAGAQAWAERVLEGHELPTAFFAFGSGTGWAAALEASLLVKELAQVPGEGVELREAATTVMTTLRPGHLVVDLTPGAPGAEETEDACSGRGARVVRTGAVPDTRVSPITSFPELAALALRLTFASGLDPDAPAWSDTYFEVARQKASVTPVPTGR
jgi:fructoselysine-6-P-deglycase FrlB-like protein